MTDIRKSIEHLEEPNISICKALIEFYETMKRLETDEQRGGKQATQIVMTTNEIKRIMDKRN